jgi:hypothetical protein
MKYLNFLRNSLLTCLGIAGLISSCVEPYMFSGLAGNPDYLVVDGFIDYNADSAYVSLSHSLPLTSGETPRPELQASVTITDDLGTVYNLTESTNGNYYTSHTTFSLDRQYKLKIQTADNSRYSSANIKLLNAPPIDSITWREEEGRIKFDVNSHGSTEDSRFYRWRVTEDWEYNAPYPAIYKLDSGEIVQRSFAEARYTCWSRERSSTILIGTTNILNENVVRNFNIVTIPERSIKLIKKYSINVSQQSLTEAAYTYWLNIKKTTESVGGLFDPSPSEVMGNIVCETNPDKAVIGYFNGGSVTEKRIYITFSMLPREYTSYRFAYCEIDTMSLEDVATAGDRVFISPVYSDGPPVIIGYTFASITCTDCTFYGGKNVKPAFWRD